MAEMMDDLEDYIEARNGVKDAPGEERAEDAPPTMHNVQRIGFTKKVVGL